MVELGLPDAKMIEQIVILIIGFLAGSLSPTYYTQERLRGFGRSMLSRLPYESPPGMDKEEAFEAATTSPGEDNEDEQQDDKKENKE